MSAFTAASPRLAVASGQPGLKIRMKRPTHDPSWSPEIEALYHHDMQEIWDPTINRHIWNQYHNQLDIYLALAPAPKLGPLLDILDVGCAQGTLAMILAERGHRVLAVDLRQPFLDYAKSRYTYGNIEFMVANALEMELDRRFDLIFANQIIEHLVYPERLVGRLKSLLKPRGRLVVTTPSWHYLRNNLPSFSEIGDPSDHEDKQFTADGDGHFYAYSDYELEKVFESQGFDTIEIRHFETPFISGHLKVRHLHGILPVGILRAIDRLTLATSLGRRLAHQTMVTGRLR